MPRNLTAIVEILIDQIKPNPWETRKTVDQQGIEELADSIHHIGLLQPIVVRPIRRNLYERSSGQRRMLAWKLLIDQGRKKPTDGIPALVQDLSDREMVMATLTENAAREDVDPVEEARAMAQALDQVEELTQKDLAESVGTSPANLSNRLRILRLPESALKLVSEGRMAWTTARELLCLVGSDHVHEEEIEEALKEATRWDGVVTAPDIRGEIIDACRKKSWRSLEPEVVINTWGALAERPLFLTKPFIKEHAPQLHRIPRSREGSGRALVTCSDREWRAAQSKAKKDLADAGHPDPARSKWAKAMANDVVAKRLGLGKEKFSAEKSLSAEELELLGTRARFLKKAPESYKPVGKLDWEGPPKFFPNQECITKCIEGAVRVPAYAGHNPILQCSNMECYDRKFDEGLKRALAKEERRAVHVDAARRQHRDELLPTLRAHPELARALLRIVLGSITGMTELPPGYSRMHKGDKCLEYHAPSAIRLLQALGLDDERTQAKVEQKSNLWWPSDLKTDVLPGLEDPVPAAAEALGILMQRMNEED